jgi:hypothetical protein
MIKIKVFLQSGKYFCKISYKECIKSLKEEEIVVQRQSDRALSVTDDLLNPKFVYLKSLNSFCFHLKNG